MILEGKPFGPNTRVPRTFEADVTELIDKLASRSVKHAEPITDELISELTRASSVPTRREATSTAASVSPRFSSVLPTQRQ